MSELFLKKSFSYSGESRGGGSAILSGKYSFFSIKHIQNSSHTFFEHPPAHDIDTVRSPLKREKPRIYAPGDVDLSLRSGGFTPGHRREEDV